jgi:two-component system, OmpR family, phosphate regulon sensor histidine kinase PhoR
MPGEAESVLAARWRWFWGVLFQERTYLNLVYLALSFPVSALFLLLVGSGVVVGIVTSVVGVGLLLLLGCLVFAWAFAQFERELAVGLLAVDIPPLSRPSAERESGWRWLRGTVTHGSTWRALAYMLLKLPFGVFAWTVGGVLLAPSIVLLVLPLADVFGSSRTFDLGDLVGRLFGAAFGLVLLLGTLHLMNLLAWVWGQVAVAMLSPGAEERQLWEAQRRAAQADRSRRELILNVSHELRTPVASIQAHLDSLLMPSGERPDEAEARRYLEVTAGETRRLAALVDDLLTLARADAEGLQLDLRSVDVGAMVASVTEALAPLARRERRVTVVAGSIEPGLTAVADPGRLAQVLQNLVRNGIMHTPEGGAVSVEAARTPDGSGVELAVSDTGAGIAPEDLQRVFERFYRTDESRTRDSGGFGLGLSIARDLVEAMGGTISVSSQLGLGSTFRVRLPRPAP